MSAAALLARAPVLRVVHAYAPCAARAFASAAPGAPSSSASASAGRVRDSVSAPPPGAVKVESLKSAGSKKIDEKCGPLPGEDDDLDDIVQMVDPKTGEWGGPTKGGSMPEPTRFGDWERKGRCTDFT